MNSKRKEYQTLHYWFTAPIDELDLLFRQSRTLTDETFNREITIFQPGTHFPSISITGAHCSLQCQHCAGHFLKQMNSVTTPQELLRFCQKLAQSKGVGCLISGGCDNTGVIPLNPFYSVFTEIKQSTSLFLNVHTGFLTYTQAKTLEQTGIDCASVDVVGDDSTIHEIYGLHQRTTNDYATTLKALHKTGLPTAPHICVGLNHGNLVGELNALQLIKANIEPQLIVLIALMPTQGTSMVKSSPPPSLDVARVCAITRLLFPKTEIALGCMRPRGSIRREMEQLAIHAGITRLVQPTQATLHYLGKNGYTVNSKNACCVM